VRTTVSRAPVVEFQTPTPYPSWVAVKEQEPFVPISKQTGPGPMLGPPHHGETQVELLGGKLGGIARQLECKTASGGKIENTTWTPSRADQWTVTNAHCGNARPVEPVTWRGPRDPGGGTGRFNPTRMRPMVAPMAKALPSATRRRTLSLIAYPRRPTPLPSVVVPRYPSSAKKFRGASSAACHLDGEREPEWLQRDGIPPSPLSQPPPDSARGEHPRNTGGRRGFKRGTPVARLPNHQDQGRAARWVLSAERSGPATLTSS
jgi:hypothetical protein